jgi:hypothetical protein
MQGDLLTAALAHGMTHNQSPGLAKIQKHLCGFLNRGSLSQSPWWGKSLLKFGIVA